MTEYRHQKTEVGSLKDWKTDLSLYFYFINLLNPVNKSAIYFRNPQLVTHISQITTHNLQLTIHP
jgi:hypothetical protein